MDISDEMKNVFGMKHRPPGPVLILDGITTEMVEAFLVRADTADSLDAYRSLIIEEGGRNFTIQPYWASTYDEEEAIYRLMLTLTVLKGGGREDPRVSIPNTTPLWNAVLDASKIAEVVVRVPYPTA